MHKRVVQITLLEIHLQKQVKPEVRREKKTPTKDQHLQQELGCPCESPLGCVGCGAPVTGVAGVGLFVCFWSWGELSCLPEFPHCPFLSCLSCNLARKPGDCVCPEPCTAVGGWGCTLHASRSSLVQGTPPAFAPCSAFMVCPASTALGICQEGLKDTESYPKGVCERALSLRSCTETQKTHTWKRLSGRKKLGTFLASPLGISLCYSSERKGSSKKSKQHLFVTIHKPIKQVEIFCPLLWDGKPTSQM